MITASHNPKNDNGYKVYWGNACQIIPPIDEHIQKSILEHLELWDHDVSLVKNHPLLKDPVEQIESLYFDKITENCRFKYTFAILIQNRHDNGIQKVKFCYTPMHGVGFPFAKTAFERFGLNPFVYVEKQVLWIFFYG
jgi:phosphoglucomutase/phosphopentomutase